MRIAYEPTLPAPPFPQTSDELQKTRDQTLDYISFVAQNYPPDWAEREIFFAASRLIEIIAADYEATAREDAEEQKCDV